MTWLKAHWKALGLVLVLILGLVWYTRPVDIYALGVGELEIITVWAERNEPGQGTEIVWSAGTQLGDSRWTAVLAELEALRFRRSPGNLLRQYQRQGEVIDTEPGQREVVVFWFADQAGQEMRLHIGAGECSYTSRYDRYLPVSLSGGKETAGGLAERVRVLMEVD